MSIIEGKAKKFNGTAIDYVMLFDWVTGASIGKAIPDAAGIWSFKHSLDLNCGITYVANGCQPITHGTYQFAGLTSENTKLYYSFDSATTDINENARTLVGGAFIDTANKKFGSGSLSVISANQYLLSPKMDALGTGDFCIELFAKTTKRVPSITFFDTRYGGNSGGMAPQSSGGVAFGVYSNGAWLVAQDSIPMDLSEWTHMAFTRESGVFRVFIDGVKKAEVADSTDYGAYTMMIGNNVNAISRHFLGGNIDEFLVTKGEARYTENFIPQKNHFTERYIE